jgi:hypothetical protein
MKIPDFTHFFSKRSLFCKILIFACLINHGCGGGGSTNNPAAAPVLFQVAQQSANFNNLVQNLAVGDLNGDGLDDVVIGGWNLDTANAHIQIFIQNSNGSMSDQTASWLPANQYGGSHHAFIADFNLDGKNDVFFPGFGDGTTETPQHSVVLWNQGDHFNRIDLNELTMAHGACLADVNGDSYPDVLTGGGYSGSVGGIYINNGNGSFTLDSTSLLNVTSNNFFSTCAVIRETNGNINILFGNTYSVNGYRNNIAVFDRQLHLLSNVGLNPVDGNGHSLTGSDLIDSLAVDVNSDGHLDFVAIYNMLGPNGTPAFNGDQAAKEIWLSNGTGQYSYAGTIDQEFENLYFFHLTQIGSYPAVFFSGSNNQARLYQVINGQFVSYQQQRFTDMAIQAGVSSPSTINFAVGNSTIYKNHNDVYMLQLLNGTWYTEKM